MATEEVSDEYGGSKNEATKRILHLLRLLTANDCTRKDIFEHMAEHYRVGASEGTESATSRRASKMFERDIALLEEVGYEIKRERTDTQTIRYSLVKGSGRRVLIRATAYSHEPPPRRRGLAATGIRDCRPGT